VCTLNVTVTKGRCFIGSRINNQTLDREGLERKDLKGMSYVLAKPSKHLDSQSQLQLYF
jgi:hypothetical protein